MNESHRSRTRVRDTTPDAGRDALEQAFGQLDLATLGWAHAVSTTPVTLIDEHPEHAPARVVRVDRGRQLLVATGGEPPRHVHDRTGASSSDGPTAVGDWVLLAPSDDCAPSDVAEVRLPRRSALERRRVGGGATRQIIAANIDLVLVAEALDPDRRINEARVERLAALVAGGARDVEVHVVLTGIDRVDEPQPTHVAGYPATCTSIVDGRGIDDVRLLLGRGTTATVVGASGAGKSSLVNALTDQDLLAVGARRTSGTGRHTTSNSRLIPLPGGALLVDTPGIRSIGMHADVDVDALEPDAIARLAHRCRFGDCAHESEPGCAVTDAIERGELDASTLATWRALEREALRERARFDERVRRELAASQRALTRDVVRARRRGEIVERRRE